MSDLIKLVRTHRLTASRVEADRLVTAVITAIEMHMRAFIFGRLPPVTALQEVLLAIAVSLKKFEGDEVKEFWAWCYRIARNKLSDHYRQKARNRTFPLPPDELLQLMESQPENCPLTSEFRHDLCCIMEMLAKSKPECGDLLWRHIAIGIDYAEIAEETGMHYDAVGMRINRCLEEAKSLVA
jgi:RNA polymerase sigma factor (sigma-70 family)